MHTLAAHLYESPVPLRKLREDVPADIEEIVLRCLEKDPQKRFPDVETLERALGQCQCAEQWSQQKAALWWQTVPSPTRTQIS
jgi:serine/threonine-protein kinase